MKTRQGEWIQTFTGRQFYIFDPLPEDICIEDIAHSLSLLCRFGGHCKDFYSVAEHCIRCSNELQTLPMLLHDAAEAYLMDLPKPIKRQLPEYREAEKRIERAIEEHFQLESGSLNSDEIKFIDHIMLSTEVDQLLVPMSIRWAAVSDNFPIVIKPMDSKTAEKLFLSEFYRLKND